MSETSIKKGPRLPRYYKYQGLEEKPKKRKRETRIVSPASQRWAQMSWYDLTKELLHYKMRYGESQARAYNNTLPHDFGLKRKRKARCK